MQFGPGIRIGSYEVVAPVAAGGMGEVYRARDTLLGRDVAIKVLTHAASADPANRARFEREARAVAALSHPNIVAIYSFGYHDGIVYAVIEWLEGNTLREELAQAPLSVRRATNLGVQIALGLAAAHDEGVVHRDLKPENVFVTSHGVVKLLDFGLAKIAAKSPAGFPPEEPEKETLTGAGMLLGSVGYMSPEQVVGAPADVRADVFSLGIILFEMLTGHPPFRRESPIETLNATLKEAPPPIGAFTRSVPPPLERIVLRCLEKSPAERFQSARDLAFALSALAAPASGSAVETALAPEVARPSRWLLAGAAAMVTLVLAAPFAWSRFRAAAPPHEPPLVSFAIAPPEGTGLANVPSKMLAISPDGERIVFAVTREGRRELWLRHLASTKVQPLPGTRDAIEPFWSADGQHVGFFAESKLKRIGIDGSMQVTACDAPLEPRGAAWNSDGTILFADAYGGLSRVAATGGVPTRVTTPAWERSQETDSWPQFLPDGRQFLYLRESGPGTEVGATVYVGALNGGAAGRPLLDGVFNALFLPPGVLLFADARAVKVQRVDLEHVRMVGDIEELSLEVDRHLGHAALAVSRSGTLAYAAAGSHDHRLVWIDRRGRETGTVASDGGWRDVALSPDGAHVAVQRIVPDANDIWTIDLSRAAPSRFTFSPDADDDPVWSPDGMRIAFSSIRAGVPGIYERALGRTGDDELVFTNQRPLHPSDWSPNGQFLLFEQPNPASATDIWVLPMRGDRSPHPYLASSFSESDAHFSPDGKWVAYTSDESGREEVYIQSFPDAGEKLQISTDGGDSPRWASSGHELFFLSPDRRLMNVRITLAHPLQAGSPAQLFDRSIGLGTNRYVPAPNGERFLLSVDTPAREAANLIVVLNWAEHLSIVQPAH